MNQPTALPTRKVTAVAAAGAVVTLLVAVVEAAGIQLDSQVIAALTTLAVFAAGYLRRERSPY